MSVIGFVDLLATKSTALSSNDEFSNALRSFYKSVVANSGELGENKKIRIFADCFYFEEQSAVKAVKFLQVIRNTLSSKGLFIKASIGGGQLDDSSIISSVEEIDGLSLSGIEGITFGIDVVRIYLNSEKFKGIGVYVDESFKVALRAEVLDEEIEDFLVKSVFFPNDRTSIMEEYWDIAPSHIEKANEDTHFKEFMAVFEEARTLRRKYSKLYFPILINWINSIDISPEDFYENTGLGSEFCVRRSRFIFKYFLSGGQFSKKFGDFSGFETVYLRLVERLMDHGVDDERLKALIVAIPCRNRILNDLEEVPEFIISYKNKRHLGKVFARIF